MTGQGGLRPAVLAWALVSITGGLLAACGQSSPPPAAPAAPPPSPPPAAATTTAAAVTPLEDSTDKLAHGRYLVESIAGCGNCHTPHLPDGSLDPNKKFAGAFVIKEPVFEAYARNITPDMETGIGSWSEDDIVKAMREGVRPDGRVLGPPMSFGFYRYMSDNDAHAIAAYIKSVPAIRNEVPPSSYQIPLMAGPPVANVPDVPKTDKVKYGEYLAGPIGHCMDCHTTYVMGAIDMKQLGHGGNVYSMPFGYTWAAVSANITPDPMFGLGAWSDEEIKKTVRTGIARDGRMLLPFMAFSLYAKVAESDLDAIVAYLRTIPPQGAPPQPE
jgi:mono/diheme cytochrome c family protein